MLETTIGQLPARQIERPFQTQHDLRQRQERYNQSGTEDLESEYDFGDEDDMGELSDSYSSVHTTSRPVTPSHPPPTPVHITSSSSSSSSPKNDIFKLADKAEKILGLTPGTLPYARANLESAREQVRRTAAFPSPEPVPLSLSPPPTGEDAEPKSYFDMGGKSKKQSKMTRARKAMSVTGLGGLAPGKIASVVIGTGGKEEEERHERRRKATDGVLYWQREVARLVEEDATMNATLKRRR
ncbi:hypothetical protein L198_01107 [Cryptococcus wingfieldii CBS 7118]|uniref:Uncharacterized protein n=1 Tax=Cryptococcus wingfieldii CBS 7118 TaxID=1295528 RepID=A0A1E3K2W8_9TREE|nr:hypothetical protein L198_01107 [Cryptococcus wingfieldii CBS 7118]ODO07528.1 hypothetical protein L198_01107 [Cryptococcus wingfieldii CBS 7118]